MSGVENTYTMTHNIRIANVPYSRRYGLGSKLPNIDEFSLSDEYGFSGVAVGDPESDWQNEQFTFSSGNPGFNWETILIGNGLLARQASRGDMEYDHCGHYVQAFLDCSRKVTCSEIHCEPREHTGIPSGVSAFAAGPGIQITAGTDMGPWSWDSIGADVGVITTTLAVTGSSGTWESNSGCQTYDKVKYNKIEEINVGCGLKLEDAADTCNTGCAVTITLDPNAGRTLNSGNCHHGGASGVKVVRDVCCTGDTMTINYCTINFSSCGLFTHLSSDDGFCEC